MPVRLQALVFECPVSGAEPLCRLSGYLNIFPSAKWAKYANAYDYRAILSVSGAGSVFAVSEDGIISEVSIDLKNGGTVEIPFDANKQKLVWIEASSGVTVTGGGFYAETDNTYEVEIAVCICTYRREEYVKRNAEIIRREIIDNKASPLYGKLSVIVSDNAGTLGDIEGISVYKNINAGGSGGFARCIIEAEKRKSATHMLIMDDDIAVLPESIERLYALLKCLKPEYRLAAVGGSMLRLDKPNVQHEMGALWKGLTTEPFFSGLDLSKRENILKIQEDISPDYAAWWFYCAPIESARKFGLPMPLFVRFDDVEYSLRLKSPIIFMSGICVWHEPFENKYSEKTEYYHARNSLIVNAIRLGKRDIRAVNRLVIGHLLRYRYLSAEMAIKGVEDFLKGPESLMNLSPEAQNSKLKNQEIVDIDSLRRGIDKKKLQKSAGKADTRLTKILCAVTLNGALIPTLSTGYVYADRNAVVSHFMKRRVVNLIGDTGKCFVAVRSNIKAIKLIRKWRKVKRRFNNISKMVAEDWRVWEKDLVSNEFWYNYLDLR